MKKLIYSLCIMLSTIVSFSVTADDFDMHEVKEIAQDGGTDRQNYKLYQELTMPQYLAYRNLGYNKKNELTFVLNNNYYTKNEEYQRKVLKLITPNKLKYKVFSTDDAGVYDLQSGLGAKQLINLLYIGNTGNLNYLTGTDDVNDTYDLLFEKFSANSYNNYIYNTLPNAHFFNNMFYLKEINNLRNSNWSNLPKNHTKWKRNGDILYKNSKNILYPKLMKTNLTFPILLNKGQEELVRPGDLIFIDLLNDGNIDTMGVAYGDGLVTNKMYYYRLNKSGASGVWDSAYIPATTIQTLKTNGGTYDGSGSTTTTVKNSVILVPREAIVHTIGTQAHRQSFIEDYNNKEPLGNIINIATKHGISDLAIKTYKHYNYSWLSLYNFYEDVGLEIMEKTIKPTTKLVKDTGYTINNNKTITIDEKEVKKVIANNTSSGGVLLKNPFTENMSSSNMSRAVHDIVADLIDNIQLLPKLVGLFILSFYVFDVMLLGLQEIRLAGGSMDTFLTKHAEKFLRLGMILVMLLIYPQFLSGFYFFALNIFPAYILDIGPLAKDVISTNAQGIKYIDYGKVFLEAIVGSPMSIILGLFGNIIDLAFSILKFLLSIVFNPMGAATTALQKVALFGPIIIIMLIDCLIMALNFMGNLFMSALFLIITTSISIIYFMFGLLDTHKDKLLIILKMLLVSMLQYVLQCIMVVMCIYILKQFNSIWVSKFILDGADDILKAILLYSAIKLILKIPNHITKSIEDNI